MNRSKPHRSPHSQLATPLVLLCVMGSARAETDLTALGLERLLEMRVTAASSYEQSSAEAPSAVSVVTADDIRTYGYRTLGEALRSLPGLYVTDDMVYQHLGSRGFNPIGDFNTRFLLSVNGMRVNDGILDMAYLGTEFPIDMALIERIEFVPGPGSSVYGSNAMLGVINVVTRTGGTLEGARVAAAYGSDNRRELVASFGKRYDSGLELLASVSGLKGDGQDVYVPLYDMPALRNGIASNQNGERYQRGYLRATYGAFDLEIFGGERDKTSPSLLLSSDFLRNDNRYASDFGFAALRYRREIGVKTSLEARVNGGYYSYTGLYPLVGGIEYRDEGRSLSRGGELRIVSSYWNAHKIVAGVELQDDTRQGLRNIIAGTVFLDRNDTRRRTAAYAQDEWRFHDGWLLNAGVRHDRYDTFGSTTNPRLALIGALSAQTTVKLLYGSAFRAPNTYELNYQSTVFLANPDLGPERTRSMEAVLEQRLGERFRWHASLFRYEFDDLIEQTPVDGSLIYRNQGSVTGRGIELSATALLPAGARLNATASLPHVRLADGRRPTNSPRYTARMALEAPLAGSGIRGAVDVTAVGERLDRDRATVPTSVVSNLVFTTQHPWQGVNFSLGIYNLLDRRNLEPVSPYYAPTQIPGLARHFRLAAEWRY